MSETKKKASALSYTSSMSAPVILCNGRCRVADNMLELARENSIPIVYEPETAEILAFCESGDYVPPVTWNVISKVFAFVRGQLETVTEN